MFSSKNHLTEAQDTDLKRTVIEFIKEFKELKENKNSLMNLGKKQKKNVLCDAPPKQISQK